jgi:hypothetical protein
VKETKSKDNKNASYEGKKSSQNLNRARDVYMLSYVRVSEFDEVTSKRSIPLARNIAESVEISKKAFSLRLGQYKQQRKEVDASIKARIDTYTQLVNSGRLVPQSSDENFHIVPRAWLQRWVRGEVEGTPEVVNLNDVGYDTKTETKDGLGVTDLVQVERPKYDNLLCPHGTGLHVNLSSHVKVITDKAFKKMLGDESLPTPPLTNQTFACRLCMNGWRQRRGNLSEGVEKVGDLLEIIDRLLGEKNLVRDEESYWLSNQFVTMLKKEHETMKKELDGSGKGKSGKGRPNANFGAKQDFHQYYPNPNTTSTSSSCTFSSSANILTMSMTPNNNENLDASPDTSTIDVSGDVDIAENEERIVRSSSPSSIITPTKKDFADRKVNSSLLCEHGNLDPASTRRRRQVNAELWAAVVSWSPHAIQVPFSTPHCQKCTEEKDAEKRNKEEKSQIRKLEMNDKTLKELFHRKDYQPLPKELMSSKFQPKDKSCYYLVDHFWLESWRDYIHNTNVPTPHIISNTSLLCPHKKILVCSTVAEGMQAVVSKMLGVDCEMPTYRKESPEDGIPKSQVVNQSEWAALKSHGYVGDVTQEICMTLSNELGLTFQPNICVDCLQERQNEQEQARRTFENRVITINKVATHPLADVEVNINSLSEKSPKKIQDGDKNEVSVTNTSRIPVKGLSRGSQQQSSLLSLGIAKTSPDGDANVTSSRPTLSTRTACRRTTRKRGIKFNIIVSSDDSLNLVKLKIFEHFEEALPGCQKLFLRNKELIGQIKTLETLGVRADDTLDLWLCAPEDAINETDALLAGFTDANARNEKGFANTFLTGGTVNMTNGVNVGVVVKEAKIFSIADHDASFSQKQQERVRIDTDTNDTVEVVSLVSNTKHSKTNEVSPIEGDTNLVKRSIPYEILNDNVTPTKRVKVKEKILRESFGNIEEDVEVLR